MTKTERFHSVLTAARLPFKEVNAYGSQVVITCWSAEAARKIAVFLRVGSFTVLKVAQSVDENKVNENTTLLPSMHDVWRVWARA